MMPGHPDHPQHRNHRRMRAKVSAVLWALAHPPVEERLEAQEQIDNFPYYQDPA